MARRLVWTIEAAEDFQSYAQFIEEDSPEASRRFVRRIISATRGLVDFPMRGRVFSDGNSPDLRELIYLRYRIVYSLHDPDLVRILAIRHGARDMMALARRRGWLIE